MADNIFRSYRNRDYVAQDDAAVRDASDDPLAELARLIGQREPARGHGGGANYDSAEALEHAAAGTGLDWAADDGYEQQDQQGYAQQDQQGYAQQDQQGYAQQDQQGYAQQDQQGYAQQDQQGYAPPRVADPPPSYSSGPAYPPLDRGYADEPPADDRYLEPAANYDGGHEQPHDYETADDARYRDTQDALNALGRQPPEFADESHDGRYGAQDQPRDDIDGQYPSSEEHDGARNGRRHSGVVLVASVLGLAVLGTAGAFAYRAVFGAGLLPALPPIIRASDGPNKVAPPAANAQAGAPTRQVASAGAPGPVPNVNIVSHQEQPVDIPAPQPGAPRVVATIPVVSPPNSAALNAPVPAPGPPAPGPIPVQQAAPSALPVPAPAPAAVALPAPVAPPAPAAAQPAPPAPSAAAAPGTPEPKKVHTVTIKADHPAAAAAAKPGHAGANEPLALIPAAQGPATQAEAHPASAGPAAPAAPATKPRPAPAHVATAAPTPAAAAPASGGGYAVQVSSNHTEAEARAAYHAMRAKFPGQLGNREPIIRRADLGAKGTFFRALVGPFASAQEATGVCTQLKSAGGSCIVQRN